MKFNELWTAIQPIVVVIVTAISTYIITIVTRPQRNDKLENQYQKVLAPLHRILYFGCDYDEAVNDPQKHKEIEQIMVDNYFLVPPPISKSWNAESYEQFAKYVSLCFYLAAKQLGYTQNNEWIRKHKKSIERLKNIEALLRRKTFRDKSLLIPIAILAAMMTSQIVFTVRDLALRPEYTGAIDIFILVLSACILLVLTFCAIVLSWRNNRK